MEAADLSWETSILVEVSFYETYKMFVAKFFLVILEFSAPFCFTATLPFTA